MNVREPMGVLHLFSIKTIFYDKMSIKRFCFSAVISPSKYYSFLLDAKSPEAHKGLFISRPGNWDCILFISSQRIGNF